MKRTYVVLPLLAVAAMAGWYWRDASHADGSSVHATAATQTKSNAPSTATGQDAAGESRIIVQAPVELIKPPMGASSGTPTPESVPQPRESPAADPTRMADMMARRNFGRLIAETANSDDPQLNGLTLLLVEFCMTHTAARAKAQADLGGPPPTSLRASSSAASDGLRTDASSARRLENARVITESCKDFSEVAAQNYAEAAVLRLTSKASNVALMVSELGPQLDYKALSPRQFSVIMDVLNEKNTALLALLGAQIAPALSYGVAGGSAAEAAAGALAWQLALCQLGMYCGRDSLPAREACWRYGACAGDDLTTSARAALIRDGLPSNALDKQVSVFIKAINTHDPELLGIRRK